MLDCYISRVGFKTLSDSKRPILEVVLTKKQFRKCHLICFSLEIICTWYTGRKLQVNSLCKLLCVICCSTRILSRLIARKISEKVACGFRRIFFLTNNKGGENVLVLIKNKKLSLRECF